MGLSTNFHKMGKTVYLAIAFFVFVVLAVFLLALDDEKDTILIGISPWVANEEYELNVEGFKEALAEAGFKEGENVEFITSNAEGSREEQEKIIASFKEESVDLIYSLTTPGTLVAKELVKDTPIVFSIVTYPVEAGLIDSLEDSGNNLVGTRNYVSPARQFNLFETYYDSLQSLAFVHRKGERNSEIKFSEFKQLLDKRGITLYDVQVTDVSEIRVALQHLSTLDAVYAACDTLIQSGGEQEIIKFAQDNGIPSFTCNKEGINQGAVAGVITDFYELGKISGEKAALILEGAEPSWLRTESPRNERRMINEKGMEFE